MGRLWSDTVHRLSPLLIARVDDPRFPAGVVAVGERGSSPSRVGRQDRACSMHGQMLYIRHATLGRFERTGRH
eukprot:13216384-Alexandrium_andersonii.AAC.1